MARVTPTRPMILRIWYGGLNRYGERPRDEGRSNAHYAQYIATREGVELADEELASEAVEGALAREGEGAPDDLYARYISERPRSEGLFGPDPAVPPDLTAVQLELRRHRGPVWRVVLSLSEGDARTLGYADGQAWRELTRRALPAMAEQMGLKDGEYRWVAAHHREPGHPHIHALLWQTPEAGRRPAHLRPEELHRVRRAVAREVYGPLRTEIEADRTALRDVLVRSGRLAAERDPAQRAKLERALDEARLKAIARGLLQEEAIPPARWPAAEAERVAAKIRALASRMPGHGRVALAYMPPEVREEARRIADEILALPALQPVREEFERAVEDLTKLYSHRPARLEEAVRKALADVRDRVAQAVVREAARISRRETADRAAAEVTAVARAVRGVAEPPPTMHVDWAALREAMRVIGQAVPVDAAGRIRRSDPAWAQAMEKARPWAEQLLRDVPEPLREQAVQHGARILAGRSVALVRQEERTQAQAAQRLFSSAWQALRREQARAEAEAELARRRAVRQRNREIEELRARLEERGVDLDEVRGRW